MMIRPRYPLDILRSALVVALLLIGLVPVTAPVAAAGAGISLSRGMAAPGDSVTVTGSSFRPGGTAVVLATFTIRTGPSSFTKDRVTTSATINASGGFTTTVTVPHGTVPSPYRVTARDYHGDAAAQTLRVLRLIQLTSGKQGPNVSLVAGHYFYVVGSGYKPGESITITANFPLYGGNALAAKKTVTADKNGAFGEVLMQVPWRAQNGDVSLSATGTVSGKSGTATAKLAIIHRPFVQVVPQSARPGADVTVRGGGFVPGAQVTVSVTIPRPGSANVTLSKTVTAGGQGGFQTSLHMPSNVGQGTYPVTATGSITGAHVSAQLKVALNAGIAVKPGSVQPQQTVTVTGGGYSAGVQVQLTAAFPLYGGGSHTVSTTATTNGNGEFSAKLQVPGHAAAGTVTVTAKGPNTQATAKFTVLHLGARIVLVPSTIRPGSNVMVEGGGYLANSKIDISVTVRLTSGATQTLSLSLTTNSKGQFFAQLHVPGNVSGGSYTLVARSEASGRAPTAQLTIGKLAPSLSITPASAIPGSSITVQGSGYLPGSHITVNVPVRLENGQSRTLTATVTTNGSGQFSATLQVPGAAAGGTYTVTARSAAGRAATARLVVGRLAPSVVAVPTTAVPGTQITVNGFGFAAGQTVTVYLQGQKLGTATTNGSGQFSTKLTVPANLASGTYGLSAVSASGRKAGSSLIVNRTVSTHFYFASLYTGVGYHEYLAILNPTAIQARVQITYQPTVGAPRSKVISVRAHSRYTEDVNADVGAHVSTAAVVASDVAIVAERMVFHGSDGSVVPGVSIP